MENPSYPTLSDRTDDLVSSFFRENYLTPVCIPEYDDDETANLPDDVRPEPNPDAGKWFIGYYRYRLPFRVFDSPEDAMEWCLCHPVPLLLAILSCLECIKEEENPSLSNS